MRRPALVAVGALLAVAAVAAAARWLDVRFRPRGAGEDRLAVAAEVARLRVERDSLAAALGARVREDPLLGARPPGDVLIGLPAAFVRALARDVAAEYFRDVDLTLRGIEVRKTGDVRARMAFLGRRRIGTYTVAVRIDSVRGRLRSGVPELGFADGRVRVRLPVTLADGGGRATIRLEWDSRGLASPVCGDLGVTRAVTGRVRPARYDVRGLVQLSALGGTIVADPDFPELAVRIHVEPTEASLATLDSVLALKGGACGLAVRRFDVRERVLALLARGFTVRIPQRFFRPIRLPIAVRTSLPIPGRATPLVVEPSGLHVSDRAVWLGAWVRLGGAGQGAPGGAAR